MPRLDFSLVLEDRAREAADLAAATDDPNVILIAAETRLDNAPRREAHNLSIRLAAELAWLGAVASADRAAKALGKPAPEGLRSRVQALEALERRAGVRRDALAGPFHDLHGILHGDCFYGDHCPTRRRVNDKIGEVRALAAHVDAAIERVQRGGRRGR